MVDVGNAVIGRPLHLDGKTLGIEWPKRVELPFYFGAEGVLLLIFDYSNPKSSLASSEAMVCGSQGGSQTMLR